MAALTVPLGALRPELIFVPASGMPACLGGTFHRALRARAAQLRHADLDIGGLERLAPSDLALSLDWRVDQVWRWKGRCTLISWRLCRPRHRRSSRQTTLTRDKALDPPVTSLGPAFWNEGRLLLDASRPRLRRWAANWARLAFALMPVLADLRLQPTCARHASLPLRAFSPPLAFDSTFGFPGEGPALLLWPSGFLFGLSVPLLAGLLGSGVRLQGGLWFLVCVEPAAAMETARARKAQEQRREARAGTFLEKGRPTLATTRDRRKKLQGLFEAWLRARGRTWNGLLALAKHDVEQLNEVLIWYGQWLFGNHQRLLGCLPSGTSPVASSMGHCLCLAAAGPDSPHGATLANLASYAFGGGWM